MNIALMLVLMVLTAYRVTRLITKDDFPPLLWLRDRLAGGWRPLTTPERRMLVVLDGDKRAELRRTWSVNVDGTQRYVYRWQYVPDWLAELYGCPWCVSAYVSGGLTLAVDLTVGLPVPWLVGPAVWAGAALIASKEWA